MSVEFYRGSPGKFDSRTLNRTTLNRWTGRTASQGIGVAVDSNRARTLSRTTLSRWTGRRSGSDLEAEPALVYILQRGVQWKQGVVVYIVLYTVSLYNTTPIHCTPHPLHPPLQSIHLEAPTSPKMRPVILDSIISRAWRSIV